MPIKSKAYFTAIFSAIFLLAPATLMAQSTPSTLSVSTQLVVLDATVLDKQGRIVPQVLTRDDFEVTEDKKPQTIVSFESAHDHEVESSTRDPKKAPLLLYVLDELNYKYQVALDPTKNMLLQFSQEAYQRKELGAFLGTSLLSCSTLLKFLYSLIMATASWCSPRLIVTPNSTS